jgi:hypothetical protein
VMREQSTSSDHVIHTLILTGGTNFSHPSTNG